MIYLGQKGGGLDRVISDSFGSSELDKVCSSTPRSILLPNNNNDAPAPPSLSNSYLTVFSCIFSLAAR